MTNGRLEITRYDTPPEWFKDPVEVPNMHDMDKPDIGFYIDSVKIKIARLQILLRELETEANE